MIRRNGMSGSRLPVSGGRAFWTGWTMLGLGKEEWGSIHINTALLFVGVAGFHLFYNWREGLQARGIALEAGATMRDVARSMEMDPHQLGDLVRQLMRKIASVDLAV